MDTRFEKQEIITNGRKAMSTTGCPKQTPNRPTAYQIRIQGHLGCQWAGWFDGLTISLTDNGETLLSGPVLDQAALHGLLRKVRDLGMPLLSVNRIDPDLPDASAANPNEVT